MDFWALFGEGLSTAAGIWAGVFEKNPWLVVAAVGLTIVALLVPAQKRRRRRR